jgi:3-deoxy-D-manno-octulosonate 8-phosphate phosphatase (KDO 8-P phosphatase)
MDGIMTDSRMFFSETLGWVRHYSVLDGQGLVLLKQAGFKTGVITAAPENKAVRQRFTMMGLDFIQMGQSDKLPILDRWRKELNLDWTQVAYMGDDVHDLECLRKVGFAGTVKGAVYPVLKTAHYVFETPGGFGAVREFCDLMMVVQRNHPYIEYYT